MTDKWSTNLPQEFQDDLVIFGLFHEKNNTSEFIAEYQGKEYSIANEFFPFPPDVLKCWAWWVDPKELKYTYTSKQVAEMLPRLSKEARAVYDAAGVMYAEFFKHYATLDRVRWKIHGIYPGLYQIRMALKQRELTEPWKKVKAAIARLRLKLEPQVYAHGFIDPVIWLDKPEPYTSEA